MGWKSIANHIYSIEYQWNTNPELQISCKTDYNSQYEQYECLVFLKIFSFIIHFLLLHCTFYQIPSFLLKFICLKRVWFMNCTWHDSCILWSGFKQLCQICKEAWQFLKEWTPLCATVIKKAFSSPPQAVRKPPSPTLSSPPGRPMQSPQPAPRAAWSAVAATKTNKVSTTRRTAGSGVAALQTSATAWDSRRCLWMRGK